MLISEDVFDFVVIFYHSLPSLLNTDDNHQLQRLHQTYPIFWCLRFDTDSVSFSLACTLYFDSVNSLDADKIFSLPLKCLAHPMSVNFITLSGKWYCVPQGTPKG